MTPGHILLEVPDAAVGGVLVYLQEVVPLVHEMVLVVSLGLVNMVPMPCRSHLPRNDPPLMANRICRDSILSHGGEK